MDPLYKMQLTNGPAACILIGWPLYYIIHIAGRLGRPMHMYGAATYIQHIRIMF